MVSGQSCGNEGQNIYVSKIVDQATAKYIGCYADNNPSKTMTYIGDDPTTKKSKISIQNGNFSQPQIGKNSYKIISSSTEVPGWIFNGYLLNNSTAYGYPMPYPNGNQCAAIQKRQTISQTLFLETGFQYTLSFFACGRKGSESNEIFIELYTTDNKLVSTIYNFQPPVNNWVNYSVTFTVQNSQNYQLFFRGTSRADRTTAIQNISLSGDASVGNGSYTYDMCKTEAIENGYKFFALQNINTVTNKVYCAVRLMLLLKQFHYGIAKQRDQVILRLLQIEHQLLFITIMEPLFIIHQLIQNSVRVVLLVVIMINQIIMQ
jgi:hypothetical protein